MRVGSCGSEKSMWFMVLWQAVFDYKRKGLGHDHWRRKAGYWLFRSEKTDAGSLPWICEALDFPIDRVRNVAKDV
jgi:hypothetical protein